MGSRGSGSAVVGRLFRRMISTTANSTKKNIMLSPITNATSTRRTFVSATNTVLEKHTMKVPSMGDSITEVRRVRGQLFFLFITTYTTLFFFFFFPLCNIIFIVRSILLHFNSHVVHFICYYVDGIIIIIITTVIIVIYRERL
jgi:hypothetical protein